MAPRPGLPQTLLLLLVLLCAAAGGHGVLRHSRRGSPCNTRSGQPGRCAFSWQCRSIRWSQASGIAPTPCSATTICCPLTGVATTSTTTSSSTTSRPTTSRTTAAPTSTTTKRTIAVLPATADAVGSKSQQKCEEWGRAVFRLEESPTLVPGAPMVNRSLCGGQGVPYIIGGVEADPTEFPHMAAVGFGPENNVQFLCGGTLISESWVLTAAHCLDDYTNSGTGPPRYIRLGDVKPEAQGSHPTAQDFRVIRRVWHPDYNYPLKENDVGLLQLDGKAEFNEYVRPACLYTKFEPPKQLAIASGWGKTERTSYSDLLLKVDLPLTQQSQCVNVFQQLIQKSNAYKRVLPNGIVDSMLCAGEPAGGKDSCQGDSGGPLQVLNDQPFCTYSVLGIVSFGKGCAEPGYPAVYTRVASFVPWIESIVWP